MYGIVVRAAIYCNPRHLHSERKENPLPPYPSSRAPDPHLWPTILEMYREMGSGSFPLWWGRYRYG